MGAVSTPSDVTADGGGITLKGTTDKTLNWVDSTDSVGLHQNIIELASGKSFRINANNVLNQTTLGSTVVGSSLTSVGTLTSATISGDLAVDTDTLKVDTSNDRVGINVASPTDTLNISTGAGTFDFRDYNLTYSTSLGIRAEAGYLGLVAEAANDVFISTNGFANKRLVVKSDGDVGIGTDSPDKKLEVVGHISASSSTATDAIYYSNGNAMMYNNNTHHFFYGGDTSTRWIANDGSSTFMSLMSSGKLGIGNTNPATKLDVVGSATIGSSSYTTISDNEYDVSSGDFLLDVAGDITLDADGADIRLSDGGTQYGKFRPDSNNFAIHSSVNDANMLFKGEDGGSTITALTLDMANAGNATFNQNVTVPSNLLLGSNLVHNGDTDTYLGFETNNIRFYAGNTNTLNIKNDGIGIGGINTPLGSIHIDGGAYQQVFTRGSHNHTIVKGNSDDTLTFATGAPGSHTARFKIQPTGVDVVNDAIITGSVGIGITSPTSKLHVKGTLDIQDGNQTILMGAGNSSTSRSDDTLKLARVGLAHYHNSEEPVAMLYAASNGTDNTVVMGGGTSGMNAATKLQFATAVNDATTAGTVRASIQGDSNYDKLFLGSDTTLGFYRYSNRMDFYISSNPRMHLDASKLYSATSGGPLLDLTPTSGEANYGFVDDPDTGMSRTAANQLSFLTAGTNAITIDSSQQVGVSTTTPGKDLDVNGHFRCLNTGTIGHGGTNRTIFGHNNEVNFYSDDETTPAQVHYQYRGGGFNVARSALHVETYTANSSDPRVGIGTSSPSVKLDVIGAIKNSSYIHQDADSSSTGVIVGAGGDANVSYDGSDMRIESRRVQAGAATGHLLINTGGGNVGINTASPNVKLDVAGDARIRSTNKLYFGDSATTEYIYADSSDLRLRSSDKIRIDADDDVVITADDINIEDSSENEWARFDGGATMLEIDGKLRVKDSHTLAVGDSDDFYLYHDGNSTLRNNTGILNITQNSTSDLNITTNGGKIALDSAVYILDNGRVGVGTASPNGKMTVQGDLDIPRGSRFRAGSNDSNQGIDIYHNNDGSSAFNGNVVFEGRSSGGDVVFRNLDHGQGYQFHAENSSGTEALIMKIDGDNKRVGINIASPAQPVHIVGDVAFSAGGSTYSGDRIVGATGGLQFVANGGNAMKIDGTGLGIGTTSPGEKLDVRGKILIDQYLRLQRNTSTNGLNLTDSAGNVVPVHGKGGFFGDGFALNPDSSELILYKSPTGSTSATAGKIKFASRNDAGTSMPYAEIEGIAYDDTASGEDGHIVFRVEKASTMTEQMRLTETGLGIGTTGPSAKLDVRDSNTANVALISGTTNGNMPVLHVIDSSDQWSAWFEGRRIGDPGTGIRLYHNPSSVATNNNTYVQFSMNDAAGARHNYAMIKGGIDANTAGAEDGHLAFQTSKAASLTEAMRITHDGYVGIGTTAPSYPLHVNTTSTSYAARFENDSSNGYVMQLAAADSTLNFQTDHIIPTMAMHLGNDNVNFYMRTAGYKFGVGTSSPKTSMSLVGALSIEERADHETTNAGWGQVWVKNDSPNKLIFTDDAGTDHDLTAGGGSSVSFGSDNQIPFTNSGGDDFDYSANLTFDGSTLIADADIRLLDNEKLLVGTDSNLQIYGAAGATKYITTLSEQLLIWNQDSSSAPIKIQATDTSNGIQFNIAGTEHGRFSSTGLAIGNTTAINSSKLTVLDTTKPLTLAYDGSNYATFKVSSGGALTIDTGNDINLDTYTGVNNFLYRGTEKFRITAGASSPVIFQPKADAYDMAFNQYDGTEVMRITDNQRVGIGTTAPARSLEIKGNGAYMAFNSTATNNHQFTIGSDNSGFIIYDDTLSTYRFVIDEDSGNVGIGTTSPGEKLHVAGNGRFTGNLAVATTSQPTSSQAGMRVAGIIQLDEKGSVPTHAAGTGILWVKNDSPANLYFTDDDDNDIALTNNGSAAGGGTIGGSITDNQVAIGASTSNSIEGSANLTYDGTNLTLARTADNTSRGISIQDNEGTETIRLATSSSDQGLLYLRGPTGGNAIYLDGNGSSYFNGGNVGIGTTSPVEKLDVAGNIRAEASSKSIVIDPYFAVSGDNQYSMISGSAGLALYAGNSYTDVWIDGANSRSFRLRSVASDGSFDAGSFLEMFPSSVGATGDAVANIRASSGDLQLLSVGSNNIRIDSHNDLSMFFDEELTMYSAADGNPRMMIRDDSVAAMEFNDSHFIHFKNATSNKMSLDTANGRLGIGIAAPSSSLHINGTGDQKIILKSASANSEGLIIASDAGSERVDFSTDGANVMCFTAADKVGIGTTSPNEKLEVNGNIVGTNIASNALITAGTGLNVAGGTLSTPSLTMGVAVTEIKDEDNMASNSATMLATQQSIKAYVDTQVAGGGGGAVSSYTNSGDNRILTSVNSSTINGEANFTFDGTDATLENISGQAYSGKLNFNSDDRSYIQSTLPGWLTIRADGAADSSYDGDIYLVANQVYNTTNDLRVGTNEHIDVAMTWRASSNNGVLTWMEDEDYFQFSDDILLSTTEKIQFNDTATYIHSSADGQVNIVADVGTTIGNSASGGFAVAGNVVQSLNVDTGNFAVANDYLMFFDGSPTGVPKSMSNIDYVNDIAGAGLIANNGQLESAGGPSDSRLKSNVSNFIYGLDEIKQLTPKYYNYDKDKFDVAELKYPRDNSYFETQRVGLMADNVKSVMPEITSKIDSTKDYETYDKDALISVLINSVKELETRIAQLESKL
jgi:hypothetical protein